MNLYLALGIGLVFGFVLGWILRHRKRVPFKLGPLPNPEDAAKTRAAIEKAAAEAGMTVDEYIANIQKLLSSAM